MAPERPLVAVLNRNSRVILPDEFARYEDRLQFRHPPVAARASAARNALDARQPLDEVARLFGGEPLRNPRTRAMVDMSSFR